MKKIKLLAPILSVAAISSTIVPLVSCTKPETTVTYKVHFNAGEGATNPIDQTILKNGLVVEPKDPVKDGYKVEGWYKEATFTNKWNFASDKVTAEITLHAKWVPGTPTGDTYLVNFDSNKGSFVEAKSVTKDTPVTQPTCTRDGFTLDGWYNGDTKWNFADNVTSNMTLKAKWTPVTSMDGFVFTLRGEEAGEEYKDTYKVTWDEKTIFANDLAIPAEYNGKAVTAIESSAFYGNADIVNVTIPSSIKVIGSSAFGSMPRLETVTMNEGLEIIGTGCFYEDKRLKEIEIPASLKEFSAPYYESSYSGVFAYCTSLTKATIKTTNIKAIPAYLFYSCNNLAEVSLPNTIEKIKTSAFYYCSNLESITFSDVLTELGEETFIGCSKLTEITIPEKVTTIGKNCFNECDALTKITFKNTSNWWQQEYKPEWEEPIEAKEIIVTDPEQAATNVKNAVNTMIKDTEIPGLAFVEVGGKTCARADRITQLPEVLELPTSLNFHGTTKAVSGFAYDETAEEGKKGAFEGCTEIKSIKIPDSCDTITQNAFKGCTGLTSIRIGNDVCDIAEGAFEGCTGLTSATFDDITNRWTLSKSGQQDEEYIAKDKSEADLADKLKANYVWTKAETLDKLDIDTSGSVGIKEDASGTVVIPKKVKYTDEEGVEHEMAITELPERCLDGRLNITKIVFPGTLTKIPDYCCPDSWYGTYALQEIVIGEGVTEIGKEAFNYCPNVTSLKLPNSVKVIGQYAFTGIKAETINIPEGVEQIGYYAFAENPNIKKVTFPKGITDDKIQHGTFQNCTSLEEVTFPEGVQITKMPGYIFDGCSKLKNISIPDTVTFLDEGCFKGTAIESIEIPKQITTIEDGVFQECKSLKTVTFADESVCTEFTDGSSNTGAFYECTALESITLPASLQTIGYNSFYGCSSLNYIKMPQSLTTIAEYAFRGVGASFEADFSACNTGWSANNSWQEISYTFTAEELGNQATMGKYLSHDSYEELEENKGYSNCKWTRTI